MLQACLALPEAFIRRAWPSLESSAAVFTVGWLVAFAGLFFLGIPPTKALSVGFACALGGMLIEAFSSHGLDNLSIQVAASGIAYGLMG